MDPRSLALRQHSARRGRPAQRRRHRDPPGGPAPQRLSDLPLDLQAELAATLGCEVQIVLVDEAPTDLIHRVLRDGVLLVERDRGARVRFEVDARNRYFDMQPIWREYRGGRGSAA